MIILKDVGKNDKNLTPIHEKKFLANQEQRKLPEHEKVHLQKISFS